MTHPSIQRAVVLEAFDKPLSIIEDRLIPEAISGSVMVKVFAAPLPRYVKDYHDGTVELNQPTPPFVPNPGAIGRVYKVGSGAAKVMEGDFVYVSPAVIARDDPNAFFFPGHSMSQPGPTSDRMEKEDDYRDGTLQQYHRAPLENVFPINERRIKELGIDPLSLATLSAFSVAAGAVFEAGDIKISDTVVMGPCGGTFGGSAIEVALAVGANVIALGREAQKMSDLESRLNHPRLTTVVMTGDVKADAAKIGAAAPRSDGIDVYVDWAPNGIKEAPYLPAVLPAIRHGGRIVISGYAYGLLGVPYGDVIARKLRVEGSWMCTRQNMERVIHMIEDGHIDFGPQSGIQVNKFNLDDVHDAVNQTEETTRWRSITVVAPNVYDG